MDIDTDPLGDQIASSPPSVEPEELTLPTNMFLRPIYPTRAPLDSTQAGESPSSDPLSKRGDLFTPLTRTNQVPQATPAEPQKQLHSLKRARLAIGDHQTSDFDFEFGPSARLNLNKVQDLVFKARDVLVKAYTALTN